MGETVALGQSNQALGVAFKDGEVLLDTLACLSRGGLGSVRHDLNAFKPQVLSNCVDLGEAAHGHGLKLKKTGALSPLPVEVLLGASALKCAGMAFLEILAGRVESLIKVPDAVLSGEIDLSPHFSCFPPFRGEMQLGLQFRPSCDPLVEFRLGHNTGSGPAKLLTHRS